MRSSSVLLAVALLYLGLSGTTLAADNPLPATAAEFVADFVPKWADHEKVQATLEDSGANWTELASALQTYTPSGGEDTDTQHAYRNMIWLLTSAPHLDRLELTSAMLVRNMDMALADAETHGYDPASEFFQRYVLNYRLDDEPVTDWRGELASRYAASTSPAAVASAVAASFTVRERGFFGPLADPVSVDNARAGTSRELAVLTAAAVRSRGYATRFVSEGLSGASWVEAYTGDPREYDPAAWSPLYPTAPEHNGDPAYAAELCGGRLAVVTAGDAFGQEQVTAHYGEVCGLAIDFTRGGELVPDYEHWSVTALNKGQIVPLDDLGYPLSEMDYPLDGEDGERTIYYLGAPGAYQLQAGVRYPGGIIDLLTRDFTTEPGGFVELSIALDAPADLPLAGLAERQVTLPPAGIDPAPRAWLFVIFDDSEPSVRILELLKGYQTDPRVAYEAESYVADSPELQALTRETLQVKDDDPKPVVILVIDGETKIYRRGYDLSIAQWIERALEDAEL